MSDSARPRARQNSITGRDGYLVCQALAYAIVAIEQRPDRYQEWSNKEQMKLLLEHYCPAQWPKEDFLANARKHLTGVGHPAGDGKVITFPNNPDVA